MLGRLPSVRASSRAPPVRGIGEWLRTYTTGNAPLEGNSVEASTKDVASASSVPPGYIPQSQIRVLRSASALREWRLKKSKHKSWDRGIPADIGLVPTMGALHAGHLGLIRSAAKTSRHVVVSIFVNPTQFGENEDLTSYPRTWDHDCSVLKMLDDQLRDEGSRGRISAVFAPTAETMYPFGTPSQTVDAQGAFVNITPLSSILEGKSRPTFFRGVATVCMKLFHLVEPDNAHFGLKDIQQYVLLRRMVKDFQMPIRLHGGSISREPDGLAMSSRNVYLGTQRRLLAPILHRCLKAGEAVFQQGATTRSQILAAIDKTIEDSPAVLGVDFEVDYFSIGDIETLEEIEQVDPRRGAILSGAIKMLPVKPRAEGSLQPGEEREVRLIDNLTLHLHKDSASGEQTRSSDQVVTTDYWRLSTNPVAT